MGKTPFPLTFQFRPMMLRGIEAPWGRSDGIVMWLRTLGEASCIESLSHSAQGSQEEADGIAK